MKSLAMMSMKNQLMVIATLMLMQTPLPADVRMPHVLSSNMVLQQDKPVVLWGWADVGETVTVQIGSATQSTTATDRGEWRVAMPAMKASHTPQTITISGRNKVVLENILVGEVWLCAGQSNMEMGIKNVERADQEIAAADYPEIRLFIVPNQIGTVPQPDVDSQWTVCSPATVATGGRWGGFSAAGYFFGRHLHQTLHVPVGLIHAAWGATEIEPWTPPEGFAEVPALADLHAAVIQSSPGTPEYQKRADALITETEQWLAAAQRARQSHAPLPPIPAQPAQLLPLRDEHQATALYNSMIHPLVPLSMRGMIWYQGEANHGDGMKYVEKTRALVAGWRKVFNQPDLAFYYTQIAPWNYGNENPELLPEFWEAQAAAMSIPGTGMIVTTDIGDLVDIHPKKKQEVGRRLALWALAKTYGLSSTVYSGPMVQSMTAEGRTLRIRFDHADGGLASRDGKPLTWFEIADAERGGFVPATVTIDGDSLLLSAPSVARPAAARFAWNKRAEPNLINRAGLPAVPFRAGLASDRDTLTRQAPEALGYKLVYDLDLHRLREKIQYDVDNRSRIKGPIDRIAYYLELGTPSGQPQFIYISMDAFTTDLSKIGIPDVASGAVFQQPVRDMNVISNVPGIVTGMGFAGGCIEFWPNNYGPANGANVPGASGERLDFGDQIDAGVTNGYGSMQIHNAAARQTLMAINNWKSGASADLGIGNASAANTDWTFAGNAGSYSLKRLRVLVRLKNNP